MCSKQSKETAVKIQHSTAIDLKELLLKKSREIEKKHHEVVTQLYTSFLDI